MKPEYIIGGLMFLVAFGGLLVTYFGPIMDLKEKVGQLKGLNYQGVLDRLGVLENKVGNVNLMEMSNKVVAVETKMTVFWDAVGDLVKDVLHHPIQFRKDDLMDRFPNLSEEELCELRDILVKEQDELKISSGSRDKIYALAVGLKLAQIQSTLIDKKFNCK